MFVLTVFGFGGGGDCFDLVLDFRLVDGLVSCLVKTWDCVIPASASFSSILFFLGVLV